MGKRNFLYRLLNPLTNVNDLNNSYDITNHLLSSNWEYYRSNLNNIRDMEKLRRKLIMKKNQSKRFYNFS